MSSLTKEQLLAAVKVAERTDPEGECAIPSTALLEILRLALIGIEFEENMQ